jgi:hypothetical protein
MQSHHLDSPNHQEPMCDPGDYLIESLQNYYAFGEPGLARQDLRKFALMLQQLHYQNFHTSYSLLWLQMLMRYYDCTGDAALVKELAPLVHGLLDTYTGYIGRNGIISEAPNYMFMDWGKLEGFDLHHPPAVIGQGYLTAFFYQGLADGVRVAKLCDQPDRAAKYSALRSDISRAFNRELWNDAQGLYRDGKPFQTSVKPGRWLPADKELETFSPQVNCLAVLYDLALPEKRAGIMRKVMDGKPINCQPYFMYFLFDALHEAGVFDDYAVDQMHRWHINPETQTYPEMWQSGDLSHAWGGAPLISMSGTILGVKPLTPGFDQVLIDPHACGLQWARGTVPTPHGPVEVSWNQKDRSLSVTIPAGATGLVRLSSNRTEEAASGTHHYSWPK